MEFKGISKDWHREDILAEIRKKKKSLAALSRENGLSSGTLNKALSSNWPRGQRIIALTIGVPPEEIWPSRYQITQRKQEKRSPQPSHNEDHSQCSKATGRGNEKINQDE